MVVLCGVAACGKSTFARRNFSDTQVVSSDLCRAVLSDDASNQRVSGKAFQLLHWITSERLRLGRTTVVDSTALTRRARKDLLAIANERGAHKVLILFDIPVAECQARDLLRERQVGPEIISRQHKEFQRALLTAPGEGWDEIITLTDKNTDKARLIAQQGSFDLRYLRGPFDIIGDLHGCSAELRELLPKLGYVETSPLAYHHPLGRTLVFLGDLADRGPRNAEALELAMSLTALGVALFTPGNHDNKLMRYLQGHKVQQTEGLAQTVAQVEAANQQNPTFKERVRHFLEDAPPYLWLDGGALVVAHAGIKAAMIGHDDQAIRRMCLYGDITGEKNPDGTPVRLDWANSYTGSAAVVYGHTPKPGPTWRNNTVNIDQGCVFGGWLTAMRWPEREAVLVRAHAVYYTQRTPAFLLDVIENLPK